MPQIPAEELARIQRAMDIAEEVGKPTDEVPPITNTSEPEQQSKEPEWFEAEGTHPQTALPMAQHTYIEKVIAAHKTAGAALSALLDLLGDVRLGHLFPVPQELLTQFNSEGPLATDDPALRRYGATFGVTARVYTQVDLALNIVQQASDTFVAFANDVTRDAKVARGDASGQSKDPSTDPLAMLRELASKLGGTVMTLGKDGTITPLTTPDDDLKIVQAALTEAPAA